MSERAQVGREAPLERRQGLPRMALLRDVTPHLADDIRSVLPRDYVALPSALTAQYGNASAARRAGSDG